MWVVKGLPARVCRQGDIEGLPRRLHEAAGPLQYGERRVAFIQMADLRCDAERGEQSPAADAEHQLLQNAQIGSPAIKLAGDTAKGWVVGGVVAVEQVKLRPADLDLPGAQLDQIG